MNTVEGTRIAAAAITIGDIARTSILVSTPADQRAALEAKYKAHDDAQAALKSVRAELVLAGVGKSHLTAFDKIIKKHSKLLTRPTVLQTSYQAAYGNWSTMFPATPKTTSATGTVEGRVS